MTINAYNNTFAGEDRQFFDNPFPAMYTMVRYAGDGRPNASIISRTELVSKFKVSIDKPTFTAYKFVNADGNEVVATPEKNNNKLVILTTYVENIPCSEVVTLNSVSQKYGSVIAASIDKNIG